VSRSSAFALSLSKIAALRNDTLGGPLTLSQWPLAVMRGPPFDFGRRGRTSLAMRAEQPEPALSEAEGLRASDGGRQTADG
jgi:hypothetical protein